jgi:AMMECR1 domain-containing protein
MEPLLDPAAFRPGTDGLLISRGGRRGLLLPEVAGMLEPRHDAMLDAVCHKAGLPTDAWRDLQTELLVFRTCRFGGSAA